MTDNDATLTDNRPQTPQQAGRITNVDIFVALARVEELLARLDRRIDDACRQFREGKR